MCMEIRVADPDQGIMVPDPVVRRVKWESGHQDTDTKYLVEKKSWPVFYLVGLQSVFFKGLYKLSEIRILIQFSRSKKTRIRNSRGDT